MSSIIKPVMLVGKIVEKASSSNPPPPPRAPTSASAHAFPPVLHRSQRSKTSSRFGSNLQTQKLGESSTSPAPALTPARDHENLTENERVRESVDDENTRRVAGMTAEEREEEVEELKARFGSGLEDLMRKRRDKRLQQSSTAPDQSQDLRSRDEVAHEANEGGGTEGRGTNKDGRDENTVRVQEMSEEERQAEVRELEERFGAATLNALRERALRKQAPRTKPIKPAAEPESTATPPPPAVDRDISQMDLKAKYFPDLPSEPNKMAWFTPPPTSSQTDNSPRFDLSGRELTPDASAALPSNIGLHHHGSSPDLAGYTLDEIIHLCQSTVSSQRITMMGVLARIVSDYVNDESSKAVRAIIEEKRYSEQAVNLGVGAILLMSKSAGVFRAGIDLFYEALGGSRWTYMDNQSTVCFKPTEDHIDLAGVAWEDIVPTFGEMLDTDSLSPRTTTQMIRILRRLAVLSEEHCELVTPLLPVMVRTHVLLRPYPVTPSSTPPSTEVLAQLCDLIRSSRRCATALVDQGIIEPLLKFPLTLTWDNTSLGQDLTEVSLVIIASLARYGLATSIARSGAEPLDRLRQWLSTNDAPQIKIAYFDLVRNWIVCSIDPHKTTPEHHLTWAQVSAMGWVEDILGMLEAIVGRKGWDELSSALGVVVAWVQGSEVNGVDKGSAEKRNITEALKASRVVEAVLADIGDSGIEAVLAHLVNLHLLTGDVLNADTLVKVQQPTCKDPTLRYHLLRLSLRDQQSASGLIRPAFKLATAFQPGSEPLVLDLIDTILRANHPDQDLSSLPANGLEILRPLLHYTVLPDLTNVVGPTIPRPDYLKATSTLRPPPKSVTTARRGPGLPLGPTWIFSPLDELLHSATSIALAQTPPDWDPSELDLVRATLILAQIHLGQGVNGQMTRSELLLNLMKVFMLEHGQQTPTNHSETDLFRDSAISSSLKSLISLTLPPLSAPPLRPINLEEACISFLGPETPFFQWYTDFLALYESISFSDHSFTQLLFPPLAMTYPVDYRRLFWSEHTSILRGIRLKEKDVPLESVAGLEDYYEPRETDQNVLDGMIRGASRGWLREGTFLYGVAVHHLAAGIWGDVKEEEEVRKGLMIGVLGTCPDNFVRDIYTYSERISDKGDRRAVVESMAGPRGTERLDKLDL